jgi:mannose-1-phosphate guanylyltransferase
MLPIVDRPFLEHQLAHLRSHRVRAVTFACGFLPEAIQQHLGDGARLGIEISYVIEPEPLDTAGAIAFAARTLPPQRLLVCNGDLLSDIDISRLVAWHDAKAARATIALTPVSDPTRYGLVRTSEDGAVTAFVEKPSIEQCDTNLINAGTYVLEASIVDRIPPERRCNIEREIFPQLVGDGLYALGFDEYWNDIGTPASFLQANIDVLAGRVTGITAPANGMYIAPDAVVHPGATVRPGSVVGARATIGDGAVVEHSVVFEDAMVGEQARVSGVVIGEGAHIGAGSILGGGSIIAPGAQLPAGSFVDGVSH